MVSVLIIVSVLIMVSVLIIVSVLIMVSVLIILSQTGLFLALAARYIKYRAGTTRFSTPCQ